MDAGLAAVRGFKKKCGAVIGRLPIRTRLFLLMFGLILGFLGIIFLTSSLFLKPYYYAIKKDSLISTLKGVTELDFSDTGDNGCAGETLRLRLRSLEESGSIRMIILDDSMRVFYTEDEGDTAFRRYDRQSSVREWFNSAFEMIGENYEGEGSVNSPIIGRRRNAVTGTDYLSLYAVVPMTLNGDVRYYYVLMNTPLSAIEDAVTAFNGFALMLGIIAMIVSGVLTLLLCSRFVAPILEINQATKRMADMNFDVELDIRSRDELGQLAESINHLSSELESKIGQLRVANEQLRRDIEEKEKIDVMRRQLISDVSHELKTPLAIIMGYCEGLQLDVNSEERDYYCGVIADEAVKMNNLAARLLNVAELESGAMLDFTTFSLSELAEERLHTLSYIFAERGITTAFRSSGEGTVTADSGRIEEVMNNLLSNAQNHTPDGGRITVEVTEDREAVTCRVFNSGSLIPEESLERIWDSFYKVDKARTRKYGGSGLGLKIVSTILRMHGGTYRAENAEDGVAFTFTLPRRPAAS